MPFSRPSTRSSKNPPSPKPSLNQAQAQPPEATVACNDDVQISCLSVKTEWAAAVARSALLAGKWISDFWQPELRAMFADKPGDHVPESPLGHNKVRKVTT